jgi:hypothetical protein
LVKSSCQKVDLQLRGREFESYEEANHYSTFIWIKAWNNSLLCICFNSANGKVDFEDGQLISKSQLAKLKNNKHFYLLSYIHFKKYFYVIKYWFEERGVKV